MSESVRCFLALPVAESVRARLALVQARLARSLSRARWVRPADLHLTLRFYGDVAEPDLERLQGALRAVLAGSGTVTLSLRGLGAFPGPGQARVIWAGVEAGDALRTLAARVEQASGAAGFPPDGRAFHPHVTLGRLREPRPVAAALDEFAGQAFGGWEATAAVLYASRLTPAGPIYSELARFDLRPAL